MVAETGRFGLRVDKGYKRQTGRRSFGPPLSLTRVNAVAGHRAVPLGKEISIFEARELFCPMIVSNRDPDGESLYLFEIIVKLI